MRFNTLNIWLITLVLLTIVALLLPEVIPKKKRIAIPGDPFNHHLYLEQSDDGQTHQSWINRDNHAWECAVEKVNSYLVCSSYMILGRGDTVVGVDLTNFENMNLHVNYQGRANKLNVFLRNFNPSYSIAGDDGDSTKFHVLTLRNDDFNRDIRVDLQEFRVADWWIDAHELPRHLSRPDLSNIVVMGFQFEGGLPVGNHEVQIQTVYFTGDWLPRESWYLGILSAWLFGAFSFALVRMLILSRQSRAAKQQIDVLENYNDQLRHEKRRIQLLSLRDSLTGIFNRQGLETVIKKFTGDSRQINFAIILIDLDYFKQINDHYGHTTGDQVLKFFAETISGNIREEDCFGRWGGEEFILLCPNLTIESAHALAEKLRKIVEDCQVPDQDVHFTASFGVGLYDRKASFEESFSQVDQALYKAKTLGRNRVILAGDHAANQPTVNSHA